ncbi:MAG TPA: hypothetical protein VKF62_06955 [Planctomycetota bacterium]|nr:hypothetical protein [Planctomycetota bacterium]
MTTRSTRRSRSRRAADPERAVCRAIARNAGKYVAVARDWTRVVAVGRSWWEAHEKAIDAGFPDAPVFMAARDYTWVGR